MDVPLMERFFDGIHASEPRQTTLTDLNCSSKISNSQRDSIKHARVDMVSGLASAYDKPVSPTVSTESALLSNVSTDNIKESEPAAKSTTFSTYPWHQQAQSSGIAANTQHVVLFKTDGSSGPVTPILQTISGTLCRHVSLGNETLDHGEPLTGHHSRRPVHARSSSYGGQSSGADNSSRILTVPSRLRSLSCEAAPEITEGQQGHALKSSLSIQISTKADAALSHAPTFSFAHLDLPLQDPTTTAWDQSATALDQNAAAGDLQCISSPLAPSTPSLQHLCSSSLSFKGLDMSQNQSTATADDHLATFKTHVQVSAAVSGIPQLQIPLDQSMAQELSAASATSASSPTSPSTPIPLESTVPPSPQLPFACGTSASPFNSIAHCIIAAELDIMSDLAQEPGPAQSDSQQLLTSRSTQIWSISGSAEYAHQDLPVFSAAQVSSVSEPLSIVADEEAELDLLPPMAARSSQSAATLASPASMMLHAALSHDKPPYRPASSYKPRVMPAMKAAAGWHPPRATRFRPLSGPRTSLQGHPSSMLLQQQQQQQPEPGISGSTAWVPGSSCQRAAKKKGKGPHLLLKVDSMMSQGSWSSVGWTCRASSNVRKCLTLPVPPELQEICADELVKERELGRGQFGSVWLAKWHGIEVAYKELLDGGVPSRSSDSGTCTRGPFEEARLLATLQHPGVVRLHGVVAEPGSCAMVLEYMPSGCLRTGLQRLQVALEEGSLVLSNNQRMLIRAATALEAARGMEFLHSQHVVHFDLKSENLLCDLRDPLRPVVKIADLGLSKERKEKYIAGNTQGTLPYMAPELFYGASLDGGHSCQVDQVTEKVDVYSFGICLWEIWTMCTARPYSGMLSSDLMAGVLTGTLRPEIPSGMDPQWSVLMQGCWAAKPGCRPAFPDIVQCLEGLVEQWGQQELV